MRGRHDHLVGDLAALLRSTGFRDIRARLGGFCAPEVQIPAEGREPLIPDLTATTASGTLEIFAVETPETVACAACTETWSALADFARARNAAVWVVVPWELRAAAILRLHQLNLRAQVLGL